MKHLVIITIFLFTAVCNSQTIKQATKIDIEIVQKQVVGKDVQWVDVRTAKEYNAGHIDDAINIDIADKDNFKAAVSKLDKSKPVYIYCHMGGRSNRASKILATEGFKEIYDFSGGWKAWSKQ